LFCERYRKYGGDYLQPGRHQEFVNIEIFEGIELSKKFYPFQLFKPIKLFKHFKQKIASHGRDDNRADRGFWT
jgi:hypothetical protein